jgi:hypothetical protein
MCASLVAVVVLLLALSVAQAAPPTRDTPVDRAVDQGLVRLAALQNRSDGSWRANGERENPAITSLAVMAFLSAGHVPGEGKYGTAIERGVRWVLTRQQTNGLIATEAGHEMYHHGISTLMLAEVVGMTDGELGKEVRQHLEKAVAVIFLAQRKRNQERGGWRYRVADVDGADMSVTGWQLMALRAAKNLGCDVPVQKIDAAVEYIKRSHDPVSGGFFYGLDSRSRQVRPSTTATGILALEICGKDRHHTLEALRAGAYLINDRNLPHWNQEWFFYSVYYGSQAAFQLGGNYWAVYRPRLHEVLLNNRNRNGGWMSGSRDAGYGGESYCTAMAILALTVDYRYLPIYQRGEDPTDKGK